jgi:hypothetical protein
MYFCHSRATPSKQWRINGLIQYFIPFNASFPKQNYLLFLPVAKSVMKYNWKVTKSFFFIIFVANRHDWSTTLGAFSVHFNHKSKRMRRNEQRHDCVCSKWIQWSWNAALRELDWKEITRIAIGVQVFSDFANIWEYTLRILVWQQVSRPTLKY